MGLLESALGAVMGGSSQQQGGLADVLGGLLANNSEGGGLQGLVEKFSQAGMGNVIPDRFFWALPPNDEGGTAEAPDGVVDGDDAEVRDETKGSPRRVH